MDVVLPAYVWVAEEGGDEGEEGLEHPQVLEGGRNLVRDEF